MARPSLLVRDARADCELAFGVMATSGPLAADYRVRASDVAPTLARKVRFYPLTVSMESVYANSKAEVRGHESNAGASSASPPAAPIPTASLTQTQGFESPLEDSANLKATDVLVH